MFDVEDLKGIADDCLEITTLGNGPHRGESVVIHLGNGEWAIIDSCMMDGDQLPLPLQYLQDLEVDYDNVRIVICTHWHGDHINGMSQILEKCENADFYIAAIGEFKDFASYVFDINAIEFTPSDAWLEFSECLKKLEEKKRKLHFLFHDQLFYSKEQDSINMYSLSPSDEMILAFDSLLVKVDKKNPIATEVEDLDANMCSLAIALKYKSVNVLICGDLETNTKKKKPNDCSDKCSECKSRGLCNVVNEGLIYRNYKPFDYVQISHHGSVTGYCPKLWNTDVKKDKTIATTTVYLGSGENLPRKQMLETFKPCVSKLYLSSITAGKQKKKKNVDLIGVSGFDEIPEYEDAPGAIVSRWSPEVGEWKNTPLGAALLVTDEVLNDYHKYYVVKQAHQ